MLGAGHGGFASVLMCAVGGGARQSRGGATTAGPGALRDEGEDSKVLAARFKDFKPVTDATLGRTLPTGCAGGARSTAWDYSPLDRINRSNANQLRTQYLAVSGANRGSQGGAGPYVFATCSRCPATPLGVDVPSNGKQ